MILQVLVVQVEVQRILVEFANGVPLRWHPMTPETAGEKIRPRVDGPPALKVNETWVISWLFSAQLQVVSSFWKGTLNSRNLISLNKNLEFRLILLRFRFMIQEFPITFFFKVSDFSKWLFLFFIFWGLEADEESIGSIGTLGYIQKSVVCFIVFGFSVVSSLVFRTWLEV